MTRIAYNINISQVSVQQNNLYFFMVYNTTHMDFPNSGNSGCFLHSCDSVASVKARTGTILLPSVSVIDLLLVIALWKKSQQTTSLNTPPPNLFFLLFFTFYVQMSIAPSRIPRRSCFVLYKHQRQ